MRKKRLISEILGKISLVLLGILVAVVLSEWAARQFLEPPYATLAVRKFNIQYNRLVGWRGVPNSTREQNTEGYIHAVVRNSRGMHDGEHPLKKEEGVFRILMIGDSFVEAEQVTEAQTNHQLLEDILNSRLAAGDEVEVISGGVGGWSSAQQLAYYRSEGQFYEPDLVIIMWFFANDLLENLPDYRRTSNEGINCHAPYFAICEGQFDPQLWYSAAGAEVGLVLVPFRDAVIKEAHPDFQSPLIAEADIDQINATLPNQTIAKLMESHQLPLLDLQPHFVDYIKTGNDLPYGKRDDFHWNAAGNQLAAQVLAEWLMAQGFVVTE